VLQHAPTVFTPGERAGILCTGGWLGLGTGLDGKGKSLSNWNLIPESSGPYRIAETNDLIISLDGRYPVV